MKNKSVIGALTHSKECANIGAVDYRLCVDSNSEMFAKNLFRILREFDAHGVDAILIEGIEEKGVGAAVMDRLRRAASV
jgi:hypothetical protein